MWDNYNARTCGKQNIGGWCGVVGMGGGIVVSIVFHNAASCDNGDESRRGIGESH